VGVEVEVGKVREIEFEVGVGAEGIAVVAFFIPEGEFRNDFLCSEEFGFEGSDSFEGGHS
jgi:hypothetical protein